MEDQISTLIEEERLLKASDVANILNISRAFSYRLMESGKIPAVRINRAVRVRPSDLKRFIEAQRYS